MLLEERFPPMEEVSLPEGSHSVNRNVQDHEETVKNPAQNPKATAHSPFVLAVPQVVISNMQPRQPLEIGGPRSDNFLDIGDPQRTKGRSQNFVAFSSSVEGPGFNLNFPGLGPQSRKQGPNEVSGPSEPPGFELKPQKPSKLNVKDKKKESVDHVGPSFSILSKPPSKATKVASVNTSKPGRRRKVFISGSSFSSTFLINRARHPTKCKKRIVDDLEDSLNQTCVSETATPSFQEQRPSDEAQAFVTRFERAKEDTAFDPSYLSEAQATWLLGKKLGLGARDDASVVRKLTVSLKKDKES